MTSDNERDYDNGADVTEENVEIEFKPIVTVQPVSVKSDEDIGDILYKTRAKLYRFDTIQKEWKERGTGDVKFIKMNDSGKIHLIMRREKTHKLCANHLIADDMELKPSAGSDRSWVWQVYADYADGEANSEILAIRFANSEISNEFKGHFDASKEANSKPAAVDENTTKELPKTAAKEEKKDYKEEPKPVAQEKTIEEEPQVAAAVDEATEEVNSAKNEQEEQEEASIAEKEHESAEASTEIAEQLAKASIEEPEEPKQQTDL